MKRTLCALAALATLCAVQAQAQTVKAGYWETTSKIRMRSRARTSTSLTL